MLRTTIIHLVLIVLCSTATAQKRDPEQDVSLRGKRTFALTGWKSYAPDGSDLGGGGIIGRFNRDVARRIAEAGGDKVGMATLRFSIEPKLEGEGAKRRAILKVVAAPDALTWNSDLKPEHLKIARREAKFLLARLRRWQVPVTDELRRRLIREGLLTFRLDHEFSHLVFLGRPKNVLVTVMPPLVADGSNLEQIIKMVTQRLRQVATLERRIDGVEKELIERNEKIGILKGYEDELVGIAEELERRHEVIEEHELYEERLIDLEKKKIDLRLAIAQGRLDLVEAVAMIWVDPKTGKRVITRKGKPVTRGARRLAELREAARERITLREDALANSKLPADRRAALENAIARARAELAALDALEKSETAARRARLARNEKDLADAVARARKEREDVDARRDKDREARIGLGRLIHRHDELVAEIGTRAQRVPELNRRRLAAIGSPPRKIRADYTLKARDRAGRTSLAVEQALAKLREPLAGKLGELVTADAGLLQLTVNLMRLKKAGALAMAKAVEDLAQEDEGNYPSLSKDIEAFKKTVDGFEDFYSKFDDRLDKLDKALDYGLDDKKGRGLIKKVKDRLEIVGKTLGNLKKGVDAAKKVAEISNDLDRDRPIEALAGMLELVSGQAGKIPVAGDFISGMLEYYAKAARAIGKKSREISDYIVQDTLKKLAPRLPPERKLYTKKDVDAMIKLRLSDWNDKISNRVTIIYQIRRLAWLLGQKPSVSIRD